MKQEIAIRSATVGDLRDIIQIEQHAATAAHWTGATYSRLLSAEARSNPKRIMLVAERADQIVGFAAAAALFTNAKPPECELENIAISTHAVRTGVGRALLLRVSEWALGLGAKTLNAEVRESNVPALALYSAAGFEEIARRKSYYADPAEDAVLLKLHL